jgi:hypothetical protein
MGYGRPKDPSSDKVRVRDHCRPRPGSRGQRRCVAGAGGSARCGGRCRSGRGHVLPLVPREDDERFGSQQVKALVASMVRAAFLGAARVADQNERGLRVTLYLLPQAQ